LLSANGRFASKRSGRELKRIDWSVSKRYVKKINESAWRGKQVERENAERDRAALAEAERRRLTDEKTARRGATRDGCKG
jgi:hypothetical protein